MATLSDTNYKVYGYDPAKNSALSGAVVLDEDEPFLEYGDIMGRPDIWKINFNVLLFQSSKNLTEATKSMDTMLAAVVMNLGEWTLTNLESHYKVQFNTGSQYLVSKLSVTNILEIGDVM